MRALMALISLVSFAPQHVGSGDDVQARNTQSVIEAVTPALPHDVQLSVVGSDTFLRVKSIGHTVQILGYESEPYMRISQSGVVQVNDSSQTTVLNGDRYGNVDLSSFKKSDIPKWRTIATNGVAMWHDHRSHWMSPKTPQVIDENGTVQRWTVPLVVDDMRTTVAGVLYLRHSASQWWWSIAVVVAALSVVVVRKKYLALQLLLLAIALAGTIVGACEFLGLPSGARITPILLMFSGASTLIVAGALVGARRMMPSHVVAALIAGAGGSLVTATWLCVNQVRASYVPGLDNAVMARVALTAMAGVGAVAIADAFVRITKSTEVK